MNIYLKEYCVQTEMMWCEEEIKAMQNAVDKFKKFDVTAATERQITEQMALMSKFC
jgi:hypothetical protein